MPQAVIERSASSKTNIEPKPVVEIRAWEWIIPLITGISVALFVYGTVFSHYFFAPKGYFFSGSIQYDQPYYMTLARACLDMGNGIAYPNPFAVNIGPIVYSHLFMVITAWAHQLSGIRLDLVYQSLGAICTVTMFCALFYFVSCLQPDKQLREWMFLLCGLGGSIGWVPATARLLIHLLHRSASAFNFTYVARDYVYEKGQWLDSTMLNSLYPTEAFYHTVMFLALAMLASKRYRLLAVATAVVWWSHPFYGLELSTIIGATAALTLLTSKDRVGLVKASVVKCIPIGIAIAAGLAYYLVFLNMSPEHRSIVEHWRSQRYKITLHFYPVHYHIFLLLPVVLIASSRAVRRWIIDTHIGRFSVCFTAGVLLLMNHNYFIEATQPAHFARGYLYNSLVLLTMLALTKLPSINLKAPTAVACMSGLLLVTGMDNLMIATGLTTQLDQGLSWIPNGCQSVLQVLKSEKTPPLLAASDFESYGYQMYLMHEAKIRSFVSHCATPFYLDRKAEMLRYWAGNDPDFLSKYHVDYVIANEKQTHLLERSGQIKLLRPISTFGNNYEFFKVIR